MLSVLTVISMLALEASAFWRLPCRQQLTIERIDPLTHYGMVGEHVHTIHGGNGFSASSTEADLLRSTCTSCAVKQDNSAYWTPVLYFKDADGKFNIVNQTGGMLVYYLLRGDDVKAFPPGFRMIAGDPVLRNFPFPEVEKSLWKASDRTEDALRQKAVGFNCLNYAAPANAALGLREMPDNMANNCVDGLRTEVFFPSCWNGKDVDSTNHRDHMRYPSLMDDGTCPKGYETRLVSLFFETIWNVHAFAGQDGEFMFSTGDPTGYGYHGDFMNAWNPAFLQSAINTCTSPTGLVEACPLFDLQSDSEMQKCTIPRTLKEDVFGPLNELPGCNLVESGPEKASPGGCPSDNTLIGPGAGSGPKTTTSSPKTTTSSPKTTTSSKTFVKTSSGTSSRTSTATPSSATSTKSVSYGDNESYDNDGYVHNIINVAVAEVDDEPAADPNVVVVTVTHYTTVPGTTVTIHTTPTAVPYAKRHTHNRRGHKNH